MNLNKLPLFCPIRKATVPTLPEEYVRVQLLWDLIERLEFPPQLIVVEKELSQIPHLRFCASLLPQRRVDILCFGKDIHPTEEFYPLLLIECKAVKLTKKMVNQVIGYNHFLKAHFIALINQEEVRFGWLEGGTYKFLPYLPSYKQLLTNVKPI